MGWRGAMAGAGLIAGLTMGIGVGFAAGRPAASADRLAPVMSVQPGSWRLHEIGSAGADNEQCIADPRMLLQLRHQSQRCSRFVVESSPRRVTVQYTCPGAGYGRTTLSLESDSLVRVQTQGLAGGAPFDVDYEARRIGGCAR